MRKSPKQHPNYKHYWSVEEIALLKELYPKMLVRDSVKLFPYRTKATIVVKAMSLKLPSAKLWHKDESDQLRKHFAESSKEELLKVFPRRSWSAILAQGERLHTKRNRQKPTRKVNEGYFNKWSPNMAYILGFILADGCITEGTYRGYSDALKFGVHPKDIDILEKIKQELESEHKISLGKNAAHLCITSQKIVDDLKNLGISYRKSLREKIPKVPEKYTRDFIRGIVDGDGSISFDTRRGYPTLSVCGGRNTMQFIRDHFLLLLGINSKVGRRKKSKHYLYSIAYRANSAKSLIDYLYNNADLYLERKFRLARHSSTINMKQRKKYSEDEDEILKQFYRLLSKDGVFSKLPNRSWTSIGQRAHALGIHKYNIQKAR